MNDIRVKRVPITKKTQNNLLLSLPSLSLNGEAMRVNKLINTIKIPIKRKPITLFTKKKS